MVSDKEFVNQLLNDPLSAITPYSKVDEISQCYYYSNNKDIPLINDVSFINTSLYLYNCKGWDKKIEQRLRDEFKFVHVLMYHSKYTTIFFKSQ